MLDHKKNKIKKILIPGYTQFTVNKHQVHKELLFKYEIFGSLFCSCKEFTTTDQSKDFFALLNIDNVFLFSF
jgi:hypothetical protein